MSRLEEHLRHIRDDVVPQRGAAQAGLDASYRSEIEGRAQPPLLVRALEQWNDGRFFEQHETLEWLWRATKEPVRDLFKGIILSGVGALHVERRNRRGALAKWTGALGYLRPFRDLTPYGIEVAALCEQVEEARDALLREESEANAWEEHIARVARFRIVWEPRMAEPLVTDLLRRVDRAWQESPLGVEPSLEGMKGEEAEWAPMPGASSIRDLLVELATSRLVIARICFGVNPDALPSEKPPVWRKLMPWVVESHEAMREPLGFLVDRKLNGACGPEGIERGVRDVIEERCERDFWVAGQITLLRVLYRRMSAREG